MYTLLLYLGAIYGVTVLSYYYLLSVLKDPDYYTHLRVFITFVVMLPTAIV